MVQDSISPEYAMPISVVIPIYHDAAYLITAVCSALQQPAVAEVLLVDDGAAPHARSACLRLEKEFSRVRLARYPVYGHDIASLLNFGVSHARYDHLAFLYADGYFLPHRFAASAEILRRHPEVDGVYEDVTRLSSNNNDVIYTLSRELKGSALFDALVDNGLGCMDVSGLLLRRKAIQRSGMFTEGAGDGESLAASMIKFSVAANLVSESSGHPVAIRRNPATQKPIQSIPLLYARLIYWSEHQDVPQYYRSSLLTAYLKADLRRCASMSSKEGVKTLFKLLRTAGRWPSVVRLGAFWSSLALVSRSLLNFSRSPENATA